MANLKAIRSRITSVGSTMQITSAMKMVSAAKLRRAQDAITQMRPYAEKLQSILSNVSSSLDASEGVYSAEREVKRVLLVAVTSNRGLCGAFNNNIIKECRRQMEATGAQVEVLSVGKKANDYYAKTEHYTTDGHDALPYTIFDDLTFDRISGIAEVIMGQFVDGKYDEVKLVYNQFKNAAVQFVQAEPFLPFVPVTSAEETSAPAEYIFEPNKEFIVEELIPKALKLQLFKAVLDSHASEHGARMTAMHQATENATDLQKELKLQYNKLRQAAITNEILEIVGGAEALNA